MPPVLGIPPLPCPVMAPVPPVAAMPPVVVPPAALTPPLPAVPPFPFPPPAVAVLPAGLCPPPVAFGGALSLPQALRSSIPSAAMRVPTREESIPWGLRCATWSFIGSRTDAGRDAKIWQGKRETHQRVSMLEQCSRFYISIMLLGIRVMSIERAMMESSAALAFALARCHF